MGNRDLQAVDEPLPLSQVLLEELRSLRQDSAGLEDPIFDEPGATESRRLKAIFACVHAWFGPAPAAANPAVKPLAALCFSGGGIRSATFNLGVLQGLAKLGLLGHFDYLSSVSGGGYISSWLARWIHAEGSTQVMGALAAKAGRDPIAPEPPQISHLRQYSNYLTPRLGLLSADTWTLIAIGIRNILLNWLVLLPLLTAPLLVPLLTVARWRYVGDERQALWWFLAACLLEAIGLFFVCWFRDSDKDQAETTKGPAAATSPGGATLAAGRQPEPAKPRPFLRLGLLPRLAALPILLASVALHVLDLGDRPLTWAGVLLPCAVWAIGLPFVAFLVSGLQTRHWSALKWDLLAVVLAGAVETTVLAAIVVHWVPRLLSSPRPLYPVLGPALLLGAMLLGRTLFVAFASMAEHRQIHELGDADREWWARWSSWTLITGVVWTLGSALVLFAPTLLASGQAKIAALVSTGGLGGLIAALGRSALTSPKDQSRNAKSGGKGSQSLNLLMNLALPLFVVALVLCLATGAQHLLAAIENRQWPSDEAAATGSARTSGSLRLEVAAAAAGAPPQQLRADWKLAGAAPPASAWRYVRPYDGGGATELLALAILVAVGWLAGYPVNINRFSMQAGYRNRLIRAYLGASNQNRQPNLFTGFDRSDNIHLEALRDNRPFPVFNLTLNLVRGQNLAWQERKAESFTATPLHCGASGLAYRPTGVYGGKGGMTLGTAVATSGAAANPNMGFNSSPAITFIMTLFSVRLGAWFGNPNTQGRFAAYKRNGPRFSAKVLLAEAFGWTDDRHAYVSLSDGGHFEDLGLYEMVRRRCHTLLVCDAGADPGYGFEDLGNAIRKIRIDFGIPIVFTQKVYILPKQQSGQAGSNQARYCAVAEIRYREADGNQAPDGTLIYIKPSICELPEPPTPFDVATYARFSPTFPHESTADQWFSETQFESYRALGEDAVTALAVGKPLADLAQLVDRVRKDYLPP
jgi:Patatin-like phospholipase